MGRSARIVMRWVLILFAAAESATAASSVAQFWTASGLAPGEYRLTEGGPGCLEGELRLIDAGETRSLMLGARALVLDIGPPTAVTEERDCRVVGRTVSGGGRVDGLREETCRGDGQPRHHTYRTVVTVEPGGFRYQQTTTGGGGVLREVSCRLERVSPSAPARRSKSGSR